MRKLQADTTCLATTYISWPHISKLASTDLGNLKTKTKYCATGTKELEE